MRTTERVDSLVGKLRDENIGEPETISEFDLIEGFKRLCSIEDGESIWVWG